MYWKTIAINCKFRFFYIIYRSILWSPNQIMSFIKSIRIVVGWLLPAQMSPIWHKYNSCWFYCHILVCTKSYRGGRSVGTHHHMVPKLNTFHLILVMPTSRDENSFDFVCKWHSNGNSYSLLIKWRVNKQR